MKNKAICTIMILILIITPCHRAYADAGTLTVAGGTIGIGGLSAGALAGLAGPAVVAVFCGMLAVGVDIELTKQSQEAGMTKTEFLKSKINQYCQEANTTANVFYKKIADNMSVTKAGAIELGNEASLQLKQFINWLYNTEQVSDPAPSISSGKITLGGKSNTIYNSGDTVVLNNGYSLTNITADAPFIVIGYKDNSSVKYSYCIISNQRMSITFKLTGYPAQTRTLSNFANGYYYYNMGAYNPSTVTDYGVTLYDNYGYPSELLNSWDGTWNPEMSGTTVNDGFTGERDEWNEKSGILDPSQGFPTTINPGLIGQIPIPADTDITTNVREYLDALQRVLDGIQDRVIQGIDQADGLPYEYDIPDTVAIDPTIGKIPPPQDSERTPVTDDSPPDPANNPSMAMEPLKFDLKTIFPFCIPFDIKDMIGLLEADPVAPTYTVNWNIPIVNVPLNFTVDLSPWNSVAVICRRMQLLLFIIGLAMVTRNLIRG